MSTDLSADVASPSSQRRRRAAMIDGRQVPAPMTRAQVKVIFPQGLPELRSDTGDLILPNDDGGVDLSPGQAYFSVSAMGRPTPQTQYQDMPPPLSPPPRRHGQALSRIEFDCSPLAPWKHILDRVHDHIGLPRFIVDLIDTPEFQRLRGLKQLGTTSYVYPGATHTRFEHSIGVSYLALMMARKIQLSQPELLISDHDVLLVSAAGLCHDLGHGPFSHMFESVVNTAYEQRKVGRRWHHEEMSVALVRSILSRTNLATYGLAEEDVNFIVLCINGLRPEKPWPTDVGRDESKRFLLDIVANKRNGIDVDKLDYFMRDSLCCYGRASVDVHIGRLLNAIRVINVEGQTQICFEEKMAQSLGDIFRLRAKLHKYAYQHPVTRVLDLMITDILLAAEPYFLIRGDDGHDRTLTECVESPQAFTKLGDWILDAIGGSSDDRLKPAQRILDRITQRKLYRLAGQATYGNPTDKTPKDTLLDQIAAYLPTEIREVVRPSMAVEFTMITYGSSDSEGSPDDPVSHVSFFNPKSDPDNAFRLPSTRQSPLFSPSDFAEKTILLIVRDDAYRDVVMEAFQSWKNRYRNILSITVPTQNSPAKGQKRRLSGVSMERADPKSHRAELPLL